MNSIRIKGYLLVLYISLSVLMSIRYGEADSSAVNPLTDQELDNLLAPIALYPDPLLAQVLPASTYPSEIMEAATWLRGGVDPSLIDAQSWDENVMAIAHYPDILYLLADNPDWTADLGDAFLGQPEDVTTSIQRLRWRAHDLGNLVSNSEQSVIIDGDYIEIIPAQPQYIYVPQYDSSAIYVEGWTQGTSPFMTYGVGLAIGGWLSMDFDWGRHHVIYHGWNRRGWVNNAKPFIHIPNVYVHRSMPSISQGWRHNPSHGSPDTYRTSRSGTGHAQASEARGRVTAPVRPSQGIFGPRGNISSLSNRGKESLGGLPQSSATQAPAVVKRPTPPAFAPSSSRGTSQRSPTAGNAQLSAPPATVFGGYRGTTETTQQSTRGQTSRQSTVGSTPAAPQTGRSSSPASRPETGGRQLR